MMVVPFRGDVHLWRRFDATDPAHFDSVTLDEGTGARHLKGGALRFDEDGCSVYRGDVLESMNLSPSSITTERHSALARATRAEIEAFRSPLADEPEKQAFGVKPDPLEPEPAYNPAHTLVQHLLGYVSNSKRRQAQGELARRVFVYVGD